MSNVLKMLSRGGAAAAETDPNFNQTVLLLNGDGTNGAQNNTFLDSSTNNFTITRNGNTTQGTFSPFSVGAGEWSNYFDGTGDYLTVANTTALDLPGDFTVEFFVYFNSTADQTIVAKWQASNYAWAIQLFSNNLRFFPGNSGAITATSWSFPWSPTVGQFYHVALTRTSGSVRAYINGAQSGSTITETRNLTSTATTSVGINLDGGGIQPLNGYLANLRVVKGTSLSSGTTYPVPTTPLTAITNTSLLTCQSNRFVDNSTNAFAITRNGDVRVTPFSPFAPTAAYSAGTNGGSGYFDGTGDSLSIANAAALDLDANFTIEAWIYPTSLPNTFQTIVITSDNAPGAGGIGIWARSTGEIQVYSIPSAAAIIDTSGFALTVNQWTHIAVTRSGSTVTLYKNGVSFTTGTSSSNFNSSTPTVIGNSTSASQGFFGYISGLRILKGTAQAPDITQPPTNITNTSLLLNFTNAGIFDNTGKNNLETVGNAQIDTAVKKYGTGSLEFDGSGDYLLAPADQRNIEFLTGDFTIECWIRFAVVGNSQIVTGLTAANTIYWQYFSSQLAFGQNNVANIAATNWSPVVNTWYHIAVTRSGTTVRQFVDGVQLGSNATSSASFPNGPIQIGSGGGGSLNGYIDDLRITKGVARYTANFTAPTKEFPDQ